MARERSIDGATETLIAAQSIVRRWPQGGGEVVFVGQLRVTDAEGALLGDKQLPAVRATFDELKDQTFPVLMPSGATVQVAGSTILAALDSVYDYVRALRTVVE